MAAAAQALSEQTRSLFGDDFGEAIDLTTDIPPISTSYKRKVEYESVRELPKALAEKQAKAAASRGPKRPKVQAGGSNQLALVRSEGKSTGESQAGSSDNGMGNSLIRRPNTLQARPEWHAPWKLMRVISGHLGWVRALAVEPGNQWFASGAGDRTIKIWDLASGQLRLTLT